MSKLIFDTHFHFKKLREKGFTDSQAESVVYMVKEVQENNLNALATKEGLSHAVEILKRDMTIRMGTMIIALAGFIKYFGH